MRTIVLLVLYVLIVIILIPVLFVLMVFRIRRPLLAVGKWAMGLGQKILGIDLEVSGLDRVDKKLTCVFMANHLSFLDGPMLFFLVPQPIRVILKKSVFRIPVVGLSMAFVEFVPVDRKGIRGGKKSIEKAVSLMKDKGYSFLIFPEGTRSRDGRIQAFRRGGFFLALESQAPIVPISIKGSFELMPKGTFFVKRGTIRVVFHPPVSVEGFDRKNIEMLMEKVKSIIESGAK